MAKAILIFSDGTGQSGGITFDENRSNIYKLYRATRCGPDSCIDPNDQITFYDPGLGSPGAGGFIRSKVFRWLYNTASAMTGLGITRNIIDCYAALIRLYRDGDRIFLFGFSRGAYTARCLAAVIAKCGIPCQMSDGSPVPLDVAGSRKLAVVAIRDVYQFCLSQPREPNNKYRDFLPDTRERIAARFRYVHKSSCLEDAGLFDPMTSAAFDPLNPGRANVYPYFIGVFDTVAAIGRPGAVVILILAAVLILAAISYFGSLLSRFSDVYLFGWLSLLSVRNLAIVLYAGAGAMTTWLVLRNYLKFDFRVPGYGFWKSVATIHFAPPKFKFADYTLSRHVEYAKHAISIDENREDFKRVPWTPDASRKDKRDEFENIHFEQIWFPGVHSDIGGGYQENEARLSDGSLSWMLAAAAMIPYGIKYDPAVLQLNPNPLGMQHDELRAGHWQAGSRELPLDKSGNQVAVFVHKSVYARFEAADVVQYDRRAKYRPSNFRKHPSFAHYYLEQSTPETSRYSTMAADIEGVWERTKKSTG